MKKKLTLALFPCLALSIALSTGCAKRVNNNVAGTDDEQMDQYGSQLEELRSRPPPEVGQCKIKCGHAKEVCAVSARICEISGRNADRSDMQQRCVGSQEDCARFNDACASCG